METASEQLKTFVRMVLAGALTGVLFDLYRVLRGKARSLRNMSGLFDTLFWLVVALVVFGVLFNANFGEVRFYVILGWSSGILLYRTLLSTAIVYLADGVVRGLLSGSSAVLRALEDAVNQIARPAVLLYCHLQRSRVRMRSQSKKTRPPAQAGAKSALYLPFAYLRRQILRFRKRLR